MATKIFNINTTSDGDFPANGLPFGGNSRTLAFQNATGATSFNGTINVQASYDGGDNYIQLTDSDGSALNITTDTIINISVGSGVKLQFVRSGGSSSQTNVDVYAA